jgi:hypothetical protein
MGYRFRLKMRLVFAANRVMWYILVCFGIKKRKYSNGCQRIIQ